MARPEVYKKRVYLGISDGFITESVPEGTADAVRKTSKNGKVFHELQYPFWTGIVTKIKLFEKSHDGKKFKSWNITLEDPNDGEEFILSVSTKSPNTSSLYQKLEGADLSKEIKIVPYNFKSEDSQRQVVGLNLYQYDEKIEPTYTKDNMPVKPRQMTGADSGWDYTEVNEFLSGKFLALAEKVAQMNPTNDPPPPVPPIENAQADTAVHGGEPTPMQPNDNADQEIMDDLPF